MAKVVCFHRPYDAAGPGPRKRLYEVGDKLSDEHKFDIYGRKRKGIELWLKYRKGGTIPYELRDNILNQLRLRRMLPETDVVIVNRDFCGRFDDNLAKMVSASDAGFVYDVDDFLWRNGTLEQHYRNYLETADVVTVSSDYMVEQVSDVADRVEKIPTACDTDMFNFGSPTPEDGLTISWVNRFQRYIPEVYHDVRDAIAELEAEYDFTLRMVGKAPDNVRELFESLASVEFTGFLPYEHIPEILAETDLGLVPLDRGEFDKAKSPTKLFEYMATGAVPVATSVGETSNVVVDGETGFLVQEGEEWVTVLQQAIEANLPAIAERGRERAEKQYSLNVAAERYNQIIKNLTG